MPTRKLSSTMVPRLLAVMLVLPLIACRPASADEETPQATVAEGRLAGSAHGGVRRFLGIPYAAPPLGPLRWRAPAAPVAWKGTRDATHPRAACPQPELKTQGFAPTEQSEDCLYLNVWAPEKTRGAAPVMVWIHGGANRIGSGTLPYYDGTALARRGIVVVTLNYRLGYLGYFAHRALDKEDQGGNFGLMDQIRALEWVQRNVAAFGGDPKWVTVAGESAGAGAILYLMTGGKADGLFARAIVESGGGWQKPLSHDAMQDKAAHALARIGVEEDADAATLRAIGADRLVAAQSDDRSMGFGPFIDGTTVTEAPSTVFGNGAEMRVPLLIGSNTWEGSLMQAVDVGERGERLANSPKVRELYRNEANDEAEREQRLFGDLVFAAPARWIAANHARRSDAFLYRFGYVRSAKRRQVPGVAHGGEIPYVFDTIGRIGIADLASEDTKTAAAVADAWAAFVQAARPESRLGEWHAYGRRRDNTFVIGNDGAREVEHERARILDAIDRYFAPDRR